MIGRLLRPRLGLLVALCVALSWAGGLAQAPSVAAVEPLPECRYDDVATAHSAYGDWRMTLLDTIYRVPRSYVPPKLASVDNAGISGSGKVRRFVLADLESLARAARQAGAPLRVVSAYRSYGQQASLFSREVDAKGLKAARESVARPGHSEHQLGTTIDFGSANTGKKGWHYSDWAETPAGAWLKANGWRFGFVMSYPKNRKGVTCYRYEPWHWRYVGREMATDIRTSGLTLREYLWRHFH